MKYSGENWRNLKTLLLFGLTFSIFIYVMEGTTHRLTIPQNQGGEVVAKVTNTELEDNVNSLLKIPLKLFPRVLCLENHNRVFSDDVEVPRWIRPGVGDMNVYAEKDGRQIIERIHASVGETVCGLINTTNFEGATTTANYELNSFITFTLRSPQIVEISGAHPSDKGLESILKADVSKTHLWIRLSFLGSWLLLASSFLSVSAVILSITGLLRKILIFIREDQFPK